MNKNIIITTVTLLLLVPATIASACEAYVPCESVQAIHVAQGRQHLAGNQTRIFYGASIVVDATGSDLKNVYARCAEDSLTIRIGNSLFEIEKTSISPAGDWFATEARTPEAALDAAMSMCPEKVINHIPKRTNAPE